MHKRTKGNLHKDRRLIYDAIKHIFLFSFGFATFLTFITSPLRNTDKYTVIEHISFSFFGYFCAVFFFGIIGVLFLTEKEEE